MSYMVNEKIRELVKEVCSLFGVAVYDIESDPHALRIYIDNLSPNDPITIDTCAKVSEALSLRLDLLNLIDHSYILEVSSPGVERKLKRPEHFQKVCGKNIQVSFSREGRSFSILGKLEAADEKEIRITDEKGEEFRISYGEIKSANLKVTTEELFQR